MGRIEGGASLPRTLARLGSHKASILPMQEATRQNIDTREHLIEKMLHPTLNGLSQPWCLRRQHGHGHAQPFLEGGRHMVGFYSLYTCCAYHVLQVWVVSWDL